MRSILKPTAGNKNFVTRGRGLQLRWLLPAIALLLAALAYVFLRADPQDMGDAHGLLVKVVIIAILLGFLLVLAVPLAYARIRASALQSEDGVYVEFRGRRMRTLAHDDALWLHAHDAHAVLGLPEHFVPKNFTADEYAVIEGRVTAYSLAGVQKLASFTTAGKGARAAAALPRWFEFEVLKPWQRRNAVRVEVPAQYKQ
jgi:hypothetical protein